jgi:molybdenum cofactor synthesis domain-containing protein
VARIAILTASDKGAAGEREDASGDVVERMAREGGHVVVARTCLPDDLVTIATRLREWCDGAVADVVITTGGTGLSPRDVTPEATRAVAERDVPGIPVALWQEGLKKTPFAVLSRGVAVTRGGTLIVNLPGNPRAVAEGMDVLLPLIEHAARVLRAPIEHRTPLDTGHGLVRDA